MLDIDAPAPASQTHRFRCTNGHEFAVELPMNVTFSVHRAAVAAVRCPTCGAGPSDLRFVA